MNQSNLTPFKKGYDERRQIGRKKGSKNVSTIVQEILDTSPTQLKPSNIQKLVRSYHARSIKEAIVFAVTEKALGGDIKATQWLFEHSEEDNEPQTNSFFTRPLQLTIVEPKHKTENLL